MAERQSLRILVVEDDADSLSALSRLIRMTGHVPLPAGTAADALDLARSQRCDLVVSDPVQAGVMAVMAVADTAKFNIQRLTRRVF